MEVQRKFQGGGGALVAKSLKGKYDAKLKCMWGGGGGDPKNLLKGGMLDIF